MTNQPPTNKGILTDKEGTGFPGLRIDDKPWTVAPFVQRYLDAIPKKAPVCFQTTDGKITKIWEDKGDQQPASAAGNTEKCTSPGTPADQPLNADVRSAPKTLKGSVTSVNTAKSLLVIEDTEGITHGFAYTAELDILVKKQKPGWFVEVTYRTQGDRELLSDVKYADRPAGQKKGGYSGGGYKSQPHNDRIIVLQCCMKVAADVWISGSDKTLKYEEVMTKITTEAILAAEALCTAGKVA